MLVRSTLFSRLQYMSRETMSVTTELAEAQKQITTGKRLNNMSDEPWSVTQIHQLNEELSLQGHYQTSSNHAIGLLSQAEDSLRMVMNGVNRAKELSLQMSNDTYDTAQLDDAVEEVTNLKERIRNLINSEYNGRFVFSGTGYDNEPFDTSYTYQGTTDEVMIDVSSTASVDVGFDGSAILVDSSSNDIFTQLDNLITGLTNNDNAIIFAAIDGFNETFDSINQMQTRIGSEMNIAFDMKEISENMEVRLSERLSIVEDVDIAEALSRFAMLQTQYEINLQLTSKTRSISLFERM
jgi:flagellar hook-associated protein 3 FlgL